VIELDFRHLVSKYKSRVYNTCLGFVKRQEDAEDLAQEVFVEVYQKWDQFRKESHISTWLYRIAVNKSLEFIRSSQRLKRKGNMVEITDTLNEHSLTEFEHPGVSLENKERANILIHAIDQLPENQRTAFILSKMEGLSYDEIGKVMDKSHSSVESLLHRAKEQLRKLLTNYYVTSEKP
jgi:RNA polymerase sigma-70 factor (family 1)